MTKKKENQSLLDKLSPGESAAVLGMLLERHGELREEAEKMARDQLEEVSADAVADDVESALLQYDYDDLNDRAGDHSGDYVEPSEAAWELLEEEVEPFVAEMKRYLEIGLEEQGLRQCQGILLGLYRASETGDNDVLGWAEDFPADAAGEALKKWRSAGGVAGAEARRFPAGFAKEHLPNWPWLLKE